MERQTQLNTSYTTSNWWRWRLCRIQRRMLFCVRSSHRVCSIWCLPGLVGDPMFVRFLLTTSRVIHQSILHKYQTIKTYEGSVLHCSIKGDSIRSYVKRFNKIKIEVLYCDESIAAMVFYKGLVVERKIHCTLVKTKLDTMAKVLRWAQKYINLEEELEVEQMRKTTNSDQRMLEDTKKCDEVSKATQRRD